MALSFGRVTARARKNPGRSSRRRTARRKRYCSPSPERFSARKNEASSGMGLASTLYSLRPKLPIERAILDRFGDVIADYFFRGGQVSDSTRHFQDAIISAGAEI